MRTRDINELDANNNVVSVNKCGFFLCRSGTAKVLLGNNVYTMSHNIMCIYTPNTLFQILERSDDLSGLLEEGDWDDFYSVIGLIDVRQRLQIRNNSCVKVTELQAKSLLSMVEVIQQKQQDCDNLINYGNNLSSVIKSNLLRHLQFAMCLEVMSVYFDNIPVKAEILSKESRILNKFIASVYTNCHKYRTVQYYADEQHLSPYYFSTIIRNMSGKSALQWIYDITMTLSKQYLKCSDKSIKEISDLLNFPDQSTFGRYFKHKLGVSPKEYRKI